MQLSKRLTLISQYVPEGSRLADIGSDHALLPSFLALQGVAPFAVAGEVNEGPYRAASRQIASAGLRDQVEARKGDGLSVVRPGEVDVVTIAGMGGSLIRSILADGEDRLSGVKRLILQPNVGEEFVRRWLLERGWGLVGEAIVEEDGKIYEILVADRIEERQDGDSELYAPRQGKCGLVLSTERLLRMGPYLVAEGGDAFVRKWESELRKLRRICKELQETDRPEARDRLRRFERDIEETEEILRCLRTDRRSFSTWRNSRPNLMPCRTTESDFKSER